MSENWGVGNKADAKAFDKSKMDDGSPFELIFGEHPHSRQDDTMYARFKDGSVEGFAGHRVLTKINLRTFNYLKCSGISGNEVRKGGQFQIYFNDELVWAEFCRESISGLRNCINIIEQLLDHPVEIWKGLSEFVGRKIYYRDQPAIISKSLIHNDEASGHRLLLEPNGIKEFRKPCHYDDDEEWDSDIIITNCLDKNIWWFSD